MHKVLGSKHLSFAYPVKTESEIRHLLEVLRGSHPNANHICFAWRLSWDKKRYRISDDGEPSGTAGRPIYGQLLSHDLTDVLLVVVRYFGGTKLGTGGLIDAYRTAAKLAIDASEIVIAEVTGLYQIRFSYDLLPTLMAMVKQVGLKKSNLETGEWCTLMVEVPFSLIRHLDYIEKLGVEIHEVQ